MVPRSLLKADIKTTQDNGCDVEQRDFGQLGKVRIMSLDISPYEVMQLSGELNPRRASACKTRQITRHRQKSSHTDDTEVKNLSAVFIRDCWLVSLLKACTDETHRIRILSRCTAHLHSITLVLISLASLISLRK